MLFKKHQYLILDSNFNVIFKGRRHNDIYVVCLETLNHDKVKCLTVTNDYSWLWHGRLCHYNMNLLNELVRKEFVRFLPKIKFEKDKICDACQFIKQKKILSNLRIVYLHLCH